MNGNNLLSCSDDFYLNCLFLVIMSLLVFIILIPGYIYHLITVNDKSLNSLLTKMKFGILYCEYKTGCYHWEFVKIGLRIISIFIV